jgi:hypothetical protein
MQDKMLKDKIKQDIFIAMKDRNTKKVGVLRFLVSLIDKKALQLPPGEMKETDELGVMQKELKNKEESLAIFEKAGREDLVMDLKEEIEILKSYLPKMLSREEIGFVVDEAIIKVGTNFGLVMREVIGKVAGKADGGVISEIVKEKIDNQ